MLGVSILWRKLIRGFGFLYKKIVIMFPSWRSALISILTLIAAANVSAITSTEPLSEDGNYFLSTNKKEEVETMCCGTRVDYYRMQETYVNLSGTSTTTQLGTRTTYSATGKAPGTYNYRFEIGWTFMSNGVGVYGGSATETTTVRVPAADELASVKTLDRYDIYYGDINGDGVDGDIYLHGKALFIPIAFDIFVPVILQAPPGILYAKTSTGHATAKPLTLTTSQLAAYVKAQEGLDYAFADANKDGRPDLAIRGKQIGMTGVVLMTQPSLSYPVQQKFDSTGVIDQINLDYMDRGRRIQFADKNNDGILDISLYQDDRMYASWDFIVSTAGLVSFSPSFDKAAKYKSATLVGASDGNFRVTEQGAATYIMPISVPAGTAGVVPEVSLSYSSLSGNDIAGQGWSLNAFSAIRRCPKTLSHDGLSQPLYLDDRDAFCLDGSRLLGSVTGYLRTEMDSSVRVKKHADYFTVEAKDGSIKFYGKNAAERQVNNNGNIIQWALSRACDSIGNCINYRYDQVTAGETKGSDFRLAEISYGYSTLASGSSYAAQTDPNALIDFIYETGVRADSSSVYIAGKEIKSTKRLKEIKVSSRLSSSDPYTELRGYTLHYQGVAPTDPYMRSYLAGIQECVGDDCLPETSFAWARNHSKEFGAQTWSGRLHYEKGHSFLGDLVPFDMNGDGFMDIAWVENDHVHANNYYNALVRYMVYDPVNKTYVGPPFSGGEYQRYISGDRGSNTASEKGWVRLQALDYNADGKMDLAFYMNGFNEWEIHTAVNDGKEWKLASGHYKVSADLSSVMLDVDSDGLVDILGFSSLHRLKKNSSGTIENPYSYQAVAAPTWSYTARPFSANPTLSSGAQPNIGTYKKLLSAGDLNGDGAADVILIDRKFAGQTVTVRGVATRTCNYIEEHYYAMLNNGIGSSFSEFAYLGSAKEENVNATRCHVEVDSGPILAIHTPNLNNDAYTDLMVRRGAEYYYFLNNGSGYVGASTPQNKLTGGTLAIQFSSEAAAKDNYVNFLDINSDGYADLVTGTSNQYNYRTWIPAENKLADSPLKLKFPTLSGSTNKYFFLDATGDGHLDFLRVYDDHLLGLHPNKTTGVNDLVVEIKNGLGAKTAINYELLTHSNNYQSIDERLAFERVGYNSANQPYTYLAPTNTTNPLANYYTVIRNPFSGPLTKEQTLISKFTAPVFEYMAPVNLVTKVTGDSPSWDPTLGQTNTYYANTKAEVEYYYSGARVQAGGRGFLGFRSVATKDPQSGVIVETRYRQDWPFVGVPESTVTYAPTTLNPSQNLVDVYAQSIKYDQHKLQNWVSTWPDSADVSNGTAALGPMKIYLARSEEVSFQFSTSSNSSSSAISPKLVNSGNWCTTHTDSGGCNLFPKTKTQTVLQRNVTTQVYDADNNPTNISVVTQGPGIKQTQTTENDFGTTTESLTLPASNEVTRAAFTYRALGRLKSATVTTTQERSNQTTATTTKKSVFTYFTSGKYTGLLETETAYATLGDDYEQKSIYAYDAFGNKNSITTQAKTITYDRAGVRTVGPIQARKARTEFDSTGRYLVRTSKYFGALLDEEFKLLEEVTARAPNGAPTSVRSGINATVTTTEYDVLGREIGRTSNAGDGVSSDVWTETDYLACSSDLDCPAGTAFVVETRGSDGSLARTYTDTLARTIRQASKNFKGTMTYVDTQYDKLGRVIRTSQPFEVNTTALYWTENSYDVLGRVILARAPDQGVNKFHYDGYNTVLTNPLNVTKEETRNGFGELVKVRDYIGASLEYKYDTRGQLTEIFKQRGSNDYRFYANGDPDYATGVGGPTIYIEYDAIGRKTKMIDPDKGTWEYRYNAFGELLWQKDGKGQVQLQKYDEIGRLKTRTDYKADGTVENHTRWYYDGFKDPEVVGAKEPVLFSQNAIGQVSAVVMTDNAFADYSMCTSANGARQCNYFDYDSFGRSSTTTTHVFAEGRSLGVYGTSVEYDTFGRVSVEYDAAHNTVKSTSGAVVTSGTRNQYSEINGELQTVVDLASGTEVYKVLEKSVRGQPGKVVYGNGLATQYTYYDATGLLNTQKTTNALSVLIQDQAYSWDKMANLKWRKNSGKRSDGSNYSSNESFCYDNLNRVVRAYHATIGGVCGETLSSGAVSITAYDSTGNIREKYTRSGSNTISGLTRMQYDALSSAGYSTYGGRHALTRTINANGQVIRYKYDQNGNMIRDETGRSIDYSTYDMPTRIAKGTHTTLFAYGVDRGRYWRKDTSGSQTVETLYLGNVERITKGTTVIWKRYIAGVAIYETKTDANNQTLSGTATFRNYVHKDHLGSVDVITSSTGEMLETMRFSVWGARSDTAFPPSAYTVFSLFEAKRTTKGFTGHEMLDDTGLVHMNGRIYDPATGRFLQADPFIQASANTQSYNRYSYVFNNPLNAVDPSGFISSAFYEFKRAIGVIAAAVTAYFCGTCGAEVYAFIAAMSAAVNGADAKGILVAAVSSYAGAKVMGNSNLNLGEKVVYSATIGGVAGTLTGGKFGHSFVASGIGAYFGGAKWMVNVGAPLRVGIAAIVGGTSSELTGGKFKNGAGTAAFMAIVSLAANTGKKGSAKLKLSDEKFDENNDPIPDGPYDQFDPDRAKSLGLEVDGNTIRGTVRINCAPKSASCAEVIGYLKKTWQGQVGEYVLDIRFEDSRVGSGVLTVYGDNLGNGNPAEARWREEPSFWRKRYDISIVVDRDQWIGSPVGRRESWINHEFGHAIGFSHRANPTTSFMSYSRYRPVGPREDDLKILFGAYK